MKIALCLSGQPRFVKEAYPYIKQNIIDRYDTDVFCHFWYDDNIENYQCKFGDTEHDLNWAKYRLAKDVKDQVLDLYKPKKYSYQSPIEFQNANIDTTKSFEKYFGNIQKEEFKYFHIRNSHSMWYSVLQSNLLKEQYRFETNTKYDVTIRSRFDLQIGVPLQLEKLDMNLVYYEEMGQPDNMVSDWFNFSNNDNMNVYSSIFLYWNYLYKSLMTKKEVWCNELFIKEILDQHNIQYKAGYWAISIPRM